MNSTRERFARHLIDLHYSEDISSLITADWAEQLEMGGWLDIDYSECEPVACTLTGKARELINQLFHQ